MTGLEIAGVMRDIFEELCMMRMAQVFAQPKVQRHLVEQKFAKIFYVHDRIFNIVTCK